MPHGSTQIAGNPPLRTNPRFALYQNPAGILITSVTGEPGAPFFGARSEGVSVRPGSPRRFQLCVRSLGVLRAGTCPHRYFNFSIRILSPFVKGKTTISDKTYGEGKREFVGAIINRPEI